MLVLVVSGVEDREWDVGSGRGTGRPRRWNVRLDLAGYRDRRTFGVLDVPRQMYQQQLVFVYHDPRR